MSLYDGCRCDLVFKFFSAPLDHSATTESNFIPCIFVLISLIYVAIFSTDARCFIVVTDNFDPHFLTRLQCDALKALLLIICIYFVLFARTHGSKESYFEQKLCINSCLASARTTVIAFNNELLADTTQRLKH